MHWLQWYATHTKGSQSQAQGSPWVDIMVHPQRDLSKPTYSTRSFSSAIYYKAYFEMKPTNFLYLFTLKTWLTTCKLFSNEYLIALCCKMIILLMESQQKHKSPIDVSRILFKLQCAASTLLLVVLPKCCLLYTSDAADE